MAEVRTLFGTVATKEIVNVASVPFRSPFRYAGGKTWFVPRIRQWLGSYESPPAEFIEPFAGGGIVGLSVAFERLAEHVLLIELDDDVAAVWTTMLDGNGEWLARSIRSFEVTAESVEAVLDAEPTSIRERAFATIVKNRVSRGGILAEGAGLIKSGENGRGLGSRWYPDTLYRRIMDITLVRNRLRFEQGDAFEYLRDYADRDDAVFFIDPPYTVAGKRLYTHSDVDHEQLFDLSSQLKGAFVMTYDHSEEIKHLARKHGFDARLVPMKNTHHTRKVELVISRDLRWLDG